MRKHIMHVCGSCCAWLIGSCKCGNKGGAYQHSMETRHLCLPDRTAAQTHTSHRPLHSHCTQMLQGNKWRSYRFNEIFHQHNCLTCTHTQLHLPSSNGLVALSHCLTTLIPSSVIILGYLTRRITPAFTKKI